MTERINAYLICGGDYHDFDFARLELLKLLHEHEDIRTRVAEDYADSAAITAADFLLTYTCNVAPSEAQQQSLHRYLAGGKKWFALHGTNSILEFASMKPLKVATPRSAPLYTRILGSQFQAHPPIAPFKVHVTAPNHPLTRGIEPFETADELYLAEYYGDNTPLLHCDYKGTLHGFERSDWENDAKRLVFYLRPYMAGEVLYLTLGHCRGKHDMRPLMDEYHRIERCSWENPVYYELLRRGIRWAAGLQIP